jgi:hypothetical protein
MEDDEEPIVFESEKRAAKYTLTRDGRSYPFYYFRTSVADLPKQLQGKFSSPEKAEVVFRHFERSTKQSRTVRNEELARFREERRGKSGTKG